MIQFDKKLLDREKEYYLGFSGGVDSLAAAHFLINGGWRVTLLHVMHFRTKESERIAVGAGMTAMTLGARFEYFDGSSFDLPPSEANAYTIRHSLITSAKFPVIICTHLNDMGESYFMNMCAGHLDRVPARAVSGNKVRPFLRTKRKDFERYIDSKDLRHLVVPDSMRSERGRLREKVFPVIGQDFSDLCRRLYIDTGKVYEEM